MAFSLQMLIFVKLLTTVTSDGEFLGGVTTAFANADEKLTAELEAFR